MRKALALAAFACALGLAGCAQRTETRVADFTVVSTRLVQFQNVDKAARTHLTKGVVGEYLVDRSNALDAGLSNGVKHAIDDAIMKASGDVMVNCVLYYVVDPEQGKVGYKVVGDVIQTMGVDK